MSIRVGRVFDDRTSHLDHLVELDSFCRTDGHLTFVTMFLVWPYVLIYTIRRAACSLALVHRRYSCCRCAGTS